jgi:GT2 family glycosyltransferase
MIQRVGRILGRSAVAEDLTVLIGNLGGWKNLIPCLRSLTGAVGEISHRVIVGFNFEGDSDAPQRLRQEFPEAEQLRATRKLGYCRTYNQLMARSTGRYVLLLDDDTILRPGALEDMVRFLDAHPDVGIAGCRTVNPDGTYQKTTGLMYTMSTEVINVFRPSAFWRDGVDETVTTCRSVGWLNGHFLMVRAEVIRQVGTLDEQFYTFQCEADWCLRITRAGWKVAYVPEVEVMHIGGAHSVMSSVKSYKNLIRGHINRYYFFRKHYRGVAAAAFRPIMSLGAMLRLLRYSVVWLLSPDRRLEAGPKVAAYLKIMLLGLSAHPDSLPEELRRESEAFDLFQPGHPG